MILKLILCFTFIPALMANPSQEDIEDFKSFLLNTKQERDLTLEEAMEINPLANPWENSGKYQGDIELMDEEIEEMIAEYSGNVTDDFNARNGLVNTAHRWPGQTIIYDIAPGFNQAQLNMIHRGLDFFSQRTCVRWVRRTNQRDFVFITGRQTGCYATVGYWRNHGAHTLNLAPNGCFHLGIVIHEMLHSAGFHHMHQTYNRYDWVWINWQNVQAGMGHNFDVHSRNVVTMLGLPYEYISNQHYSAYAFSFNGRPTIGARFNTGGVMGQLDFITGNDIWRLARLYNCPGAWSAELHSDDLKKPDNDVLTDNDNFYNKPYYFDDFPKGLEVNADKEITEN